MDSKRSELKIPDLLTGSGSESESLSVFLNQNMPLTSSQTHTYAYPQVQTSSSLHPSVLPLSKPSMWTDAIEIHSPSHPVAFQSGVLKKDDDSFIQDMEDFLPRDDSSVPRARHASSHSYTYKISSSQPFVSMQHHVNGNGNGGGNTNVHTRYGQSLMTREPGSLQTSEPDILDSHQEEQISKRKKHNSCYWCSIAILRYFKKCMQFGMICLGRGFYCLSRNKHILQLFALILLLVAMSFAYVLLKQTSPGTALSTSLRLNLNQAVPPPPVESICRNYNTYELNSFFYQEMATRLEEYLARHTEDVCVSSLELGFQTFHIAIRSHDSVDHYLHPQLYFSNQTSDGIYLDPEMRKTITIKEELSICPEPTEIERPRTLHVIVHYQSIPDLQYHNKSLIQETAICLQHYHDICTGVLNKQEHCNKGVAAPLVSPPSLS